MSKTLVRYWAYDRCLKNHSIRYTWKDLQERANRDLEDLDYRAIHKTQFFKDIKALKAPPYNAPIQTYKHNGQSYYRYSDSSFSLRSQKLNELEAQQMKSAIMVLSRFKGMPQFDWVQEVIPKLEQNFGLKGESEKIIGFNENVDLKGLEFLGTLFSSILYKKPVLISYKSFKSPEAQDLQISPYFLKQYNTRWFLFGQNPSFEKITILSLDRIVAVAETNAKFLPNSTFNSDDYFEDLIGVSKPLDGRVETVKLWFSVEQAPYILTKPLHGSQKSRQNDDGSLLITIEVVPNYELEQLILGYGETCKVLEPGTLRETIISKLLKASDLYKR